MDAFGYRHSSSQESGLLWLGSPFWHTSWSDWLKWHFSELLGHMIGPIEYALGDKWSKVLSRREREVAVLVARGLSNNDVARELGLRVGTVKAHLHTIYRKLAVDGRNTLVRTRNASVAAYGVGSSPNLADEEEPRSSHNRLIQNI